MIESAWRSLTSAVARRDGDHCAEALRGGVRVGLLQCAGPGALIALEAGSDDAAAVEDLVRALRDRGWEGDELLADQINYRARGSATDRRSLALDVGTLAEVRDDPRGGLLDLTTGMAWRTDLIEDGQCEDLDPDEEPDPDRWLEIDGEGSRAPYQDMVDFTADLDHVAAREDLTAALSGRGAFRRFQAALNRHEHLRVHWRVLTAERRAGRARAWLADQG